MLEQETAATRWRVLDVDVFHLLQTQALTLDLFIITSHFRSPEKSLADFTFILVSAVTFSHKYGLRIIFRLFYGIYVRYRHYELSTTTNHV